MTTPGPRNHTHEVNAMLRVSKDSEDEIRNFFSGTFGIKQNRLQPALHLTVYHSRRPIPGLHEKLQPLQITAEARFMVLVLGGENPRKWCRFKDPFPKNTSHKAQYGDS